MNYQLYLDFCNLYSDTHLTTSHMIHRPKRRYIFGIIILAYVKTNHDNVAFEAVFTRDVRKMEQKISKLELNLTKI